MFVDGGGNDLDKLNKSTTPSNSSQIEMVEQKETAEDTPLT
jgi:hypothetical protein